MMFAVPLRKITLTVQYSFEHDTRQSFTRPMSEAVSYSLKNVTVTFWC